LGFISYSPAYRAEWSCHVRSLRWGV
jgi:hypothetical protein